MPMLLISYYFEEVQLVEIHRLMAPSADEFNSFQSLIVDQMVRVFIFAAVLVIYGYFSQK